MAESAFLHKLPVEIRLRIYESLLSFSNPIKLRTYVNGSRDLAILRTNRQIYQEAFPVLYEVNTIIATRNDFCKRTEVALKTPLQFDRIRHLVVSSFSQSIACSLEDRDEKCDVCHPSAVGLVQTLASMPRLKSTFMDFTSHLPEMKRFCHEIGTDNDLQLALDGHYIKGHAYVLRLQGRDLEGVRIRFTYSLPADKSLNPEQIINHLRVKRCSG